MKTSKKGFTLVELLVVIGIIALLIAILLPVLKKARQAACGVQCQSNVKTLMAAFIMFAQDHGNALPGGKHDAANPVEFKRDWLNGSGLGAPWGDFPVKGTIYKYVRKRQIYRCPLMDAVGVWHTYNATNGIFDYSVFNIWPGAKLNRIRPMSYMEYNGNGRRIWMPTPIIVQEDPNSINGDNIEGGHSNTDKIAIVHNGGSWYGTIDGSVVYVKEPRPPANDFDCWDWKTCRPSKPTDDFANYLAMGPDYTWGQFNDQ